MEVGACSQPELSQGERPVCQPGRGIGEPISADRTPSSPERQERQGHDPEMLRPSSVFSSLADADGHRAESEGPASSAQMTGQRPLNGTLGRIWRC